jgi:hypothetical protein
MTLRGPRNYKALPIEKFVKAEMPSSRKQAEVEGVYRVDMSGGIIHLRKLRKAKKDR